MLAEMKECAAKNTPSASEAAERAFNKFLRYLRRSKEESEKALAWWRNVVLFFDEAETSFHPNWQRKLVSDIIDFCSFVFQDSHFHVIFATHSPIILSDIPSSNIVFLRKKAGKKSFRVNVEDEVWVEEHKGNTFGANIYDLFRDSFFLNKSFLFILL